MRRSSAWTGLVVGMLTGLLLVLLLAFGHLVFGLPFLPYQAFEWMTRRLPGKVVTVGIDALVAVLTALGVQVSAAAKLAEKTIAIALFVVASAVIGTLVGLVAPARANEVDRPARRRFLGRFAAGVAAASAALVGFGALFRRREALVPVTTTSAPVPGAREIIGTEGTSGPAASPTEELLAARLPPVHGTRPELTPNEHFYRIDINLQAPKLDAATWRLDIDGMVERSLSLSIDDLRRLPPVTQLITLECISNRLGGDLIGTTRWTGARMKDVLRLARLRGGARAVHLRAADGFYESIAMSDIDDERTLLVYDMNGVPLTAEHGFPLRIYIPNRHGMKQPKWLTRLTVSDHDGAGFWVDRGWSKTAVPHTTSVIDTVGMSMMVGDAKVLPVGGIAYAGARGISKVEVQVDEGPWTAATLLTPAVSPLCWVLWRYEWPYAPGRHTFRVRAYDGTGALQPVEERGPRPDGVAGIHSVTTRV